MRTLSAFILLLSSLCSNGQKVHSENWHSGVGMSFSSLNFKQNGAGALAVPVRYDFLTFGPSTFSLGTNLQLGSEDEYGVSFPALVVLLVLADAAGADLSNIGSSSGSGNDKGYGISLFTHIPLLLHYNFGLGTKNGDEYRVGFYVGGGMSYTVTGFTLSGGATMQHSTHFFGWEANAGIRLSSNLDIGFSTVLPFNNPIGPINNPVMYQLTLCSFRKRKGR